jgi:hypothetical protein
MSYVFDDMGTPPSDSAAAKVARQALASAA